MSDQQKLITYNFHKHSKPVTIERSSCKRAPSFTDQTKTTTPSGVFEAITVEERGGTNQLFVLPLSMAGTFSGKGQSSAK